MEDQQNTRHVTEFEFKFESNGFQRFSEIRNPAHSPMDFGQIEFVLWLGPIRNVVQ